MHDVDELIQDLLRSAAPAPPQDDRRGVIRATARRRQLRRRVGLATAAGAMCAAVLALSTVSSGEKDLTAGQPVGGRDGRERQVSLSGLDGPIRVSNTLSPVDGYSSFGAVPLGDGAIRRRTLVHGLPRCVPGSTAPRRCGTARGGGPRAGGLRPRARAMEEHRGSRGVRVPDRVPTSWPAPTPDHTRQVARGVVASSDPINDRGDRPAPKRSHRGVGSAHTTSARVRRPLLLHRPLDGGGRRSPPNPPGDGASASPRRSQCVPPGEGRSTARIR